MYVLHALSRVSEGSEISERTVIQHFVLEAGRTLGLVSSIATSSLETRFPFGRLFDRRKRDRDPGTRFAGSER
jgi:hypothetical protein